MSVSEKTIDLLGIGNAILDVLAYTEDSFLESWEMRKGDMALIDEARAEAIYNELGQTKEVSGGSVANSVAGLAMLGGTAAFIGRVKDDQFGKLYQHDLRSVGVQYDMAPLKEGLPTGCSYILVTPDGERTMNTYLGAGSEIYPDDIDEALVAQSKVVFGEGYQWSGDHNIAAMEKAFALAKKHNTKVAFSLSAVFCVELYREQFKALLDGTIDILFANDAEIQALYPDMAWEDLVDHLQGKAEIIALTRGEHGSLIITKDARLPIAPQPVSKVTDATGAGDLYAAGFLYGYTRGLPLARCGELGSLCAAQIIQQLGARSLEPLDRLVA
tara:strand:- start:267 stop:1253 length:987 start_codon:yes stop_codon:yes gene_type:complete